MKVGLSLSFCVREILEGVVPLEEVEKIVTSTKCDTPEKWDEVMAMYGAIYWSSNPERGVQIARQLLAEGKLEQPRLQEGVLGTDIRQGPLWIESGEKVPLITHANM